MLTTREFDYIQRSHWPALHSTSDTKKGTSCERDFMEKTLFAKRTLCERDFLRKGFNAKETLRKRLYTNGTSCEKGFTRMVLLAKKNMQRGFLRKGLKRINPIFVQMTIES